VLAKLKAQYDPQGDQPGASHSGIDSVYSAYLNDAALKPEIAAVEKELNLRAQIIAYASQFGESAAVYRFGDADTQRALRDLQSEQTLTRQTLQGISDQLSSSGIFPKNSPAPR
jgi:hypothetical protein